MSGSTNWFAWGCCDEDYRLVLGDAVGGARVDFAEEEVDDDAEAPEAEVVDHVVEPVASTRHVG